MITRQNGKRKTIITISSDEESDQDEPESSDSESDSDDGHESETNSDSDDSGDDGSDYSSEDGFESVSVSEYVVDDDECLDDDDDDEGRRVGKLTEEEMYSKVAELVQRRKCLDTLKLEECKAYLRKHQLMLSGNKETCIERILEHSRIKDGNAKKLYPWESFSINCTGDVCTGDVVRFKQRVYGNFDKVTRGRGGKVIGKRTIAGRVVKESYGAGKQQHTFTVEVLWSQGQKPLAPLVPLLVKGRNLYRMQTFRQCWKNEAERTKVLIEKHKRGAEARRIRAVAKAGSFNTGQGLKRTKSSATRASPGKRRKKDVPPAVIGNTSTRAPPGKRRTKDVPPAVIGNTSTRAPPGKRRTKEVPPAVIGDTSSRAAPAKRKKKNPKHAVVKKKQKMAPPKATSNVPAEVNHATESRNLESSSSQPKVSFRAASVVAPRPQFPPYGRYHGSATHMHPVLAGTMNIQSRAGPDACQPNGRMWHPHNHNGSHLSSVGGAYPHMVNSGINTNHPYANPAPWFGDPRNHMLNTGNYMNQPYANRPPEFEDRTIPRHTRPRPFNGGYYFR